MCLAIPARITAIDPTGETATVALGSVSRECSLALIEDAAIGDYVLMHVGYALNRISPEEAAETLALMRAVGALDETGDETGDETADGTATADTNRTEPAGTA